ncbi:hypothetical protein BKA64DRAFT_647567 [Cadophora sp. MPI-SDFR-AT-0126]|nr:hypothetical protein BKA64DRAFT_647567 [Leotiomycetes sp. MPI-SDFR-AT-0126]
MQRDDRQHKPDITLLWVGESSGANPKTYRMGFWIVAKVSQGDVVFGKIDRTAIFRAYAAEFEDGLRIGRPSQQERSLARDLNIQPFETKAPRLPHSTHDSRLDQPSMGGMPMASVIAGTKKHRRSSSYEASAIDTHFMAFSGSARLSSQVPEKCEEAEKKAQPTPTSVVHEDSAEFPPKSESQVPILKIEFGGPKPQDRPQGTDESVGCYNAPASAISQVDYAANENISQPVTGYAICVCTIVMKPGPTPSAFLYQWKDSLMQPESTDEQPSISARKHERVANRPEKFDRSLKYRSPKGVFPTESEPIDMTPAPNAAEYWTWDEVIQDDYHIESDTGSTVWYERSGKRETTGMTDHDSGAYDEEGPIGTTRSSNDGARDIIDTM